MEVLSVTFAGDPRTYHVITACDEHDTCPGCGAGYGAGFIECEYCKRPVSHEAPEHQHPAHPEHQQGENA